MDPKLTIRPKKKSVVVIPKKLFLNHKITMEWVSNYIIENSMTLNRIFAYCFTPSAVKKYSILSKETGRNRNFFVGTSCGITAKMLMFLFQAKTKPSQILTNTCIINISALGEPGHTLVYLDGYLYQSYIGTHRLFCVKINKEQLQVKINKLKTKPVKAYEDLARVHIKNLKKVNVYYDHILFYKNSPDEVKSKIDNMWFCVKMSVLGFRNRPFLLESDHMRVIKGLFPNPNTSLV